VVLSRQVLQLVSEVRVGTRTVRLLCIVVELGVLAQGEGNGCGCWKRNAQECTALGRKLFVPCTVAPENAMLMESINMRHGECSMHDGIALGFR
jgi:hypothetical protein